MCKGYFTELIDIRNLNEEEYFISFLKEGYRNKLFSLEEIENIQLESIILLQKKCDEYMKGDSLSIRIEVAETIMKSNLYIISLYLKEIVSTNIAVCKLKEENIFYFYNKGLEVIKKKINYGKKLYRKVLNNRIKVNNYTYDGTIIGGMKGFFKIYNPIFEAEEINITADYELCNPVKNLVGIEFINKYLENIYYENDFCNKFSKDRVMLLLRAFNEDYENLNFNIYEVVLTNGLGCEILSVEPSYLNLSQVQLEKLKDIFLEKNLEEIDEILKEGAEGIIEKFNIISKEYKEYIKNSTTAIASRIYSSIKINRLDRVFLKFKKDKVENKIIFSFGDKMDNFSYRKVLERIMYAYSIEEKIAIIKNNIKSLTDLEDILFQGEFEVKEIEKILYSLDKLEVVALGKKYLEAIDIEEDFQEEFRIKRALESFVCNLSKEDRNMFYNILARMEFEF